MSICWAPELSMRSGGVPPLKRGWSVPTGSSGWPVNLTLAPSGSPSRTSSRRPSAYCSPKPPLKMTTSSCRRLVDAERVLRGLLALLGLVAAVAAAAAGAGGQEAHRRDGDQAECGGPLDQIAAAETLTVVVGGGGSHAQVLAFSRTQAVYRSPVLLASGEGPRHRGQLLCIPGGKLSEARVVHGWQRERSLVRSAMRTPSPARRPWAACQCGTAMRTPTGIVHFTPAGARSKARLAGSLSRVETSRIHERPARPYDHSILRRIGRIRAASRRQHP